MTPTPKHRLTGNGSYKILVGGFVQHPHQVHDNSLSLFLLILFAATPVPLHS
jgi:hypothetical protein